MKIKAALHILLHRSNIIHDSFLTKESANDVTKSEYSISYRSLSTDDRVYDIVSGRDGRQGIEVRRLSGLHSRRPVHGRFRNAKS